MGYRWYRNSEDPANEPGAIRSVYRAVCPILFQIFDAEHAHKASMLTGQMFQLLPLPPPTKGSDALRQKVFGLEFSAPAGLAPGFDKNAELIPLWDSNMMGLGFAEVGSVTGRPSEGNPQPRCFRVPLDKAIINRMGLNNQGCWEIGNRLAKESPKRRGVVLGVNIAKTHDPSIMDEGALRDFEVRFLFLFSSLCFVTTFKVRKQRRGRPSQAGRMTRAL